MLDYKLQYGAKMDEQGVLDGVISLTSPTILTSASASFTSNDVNKSIDILGAGSGSPRTVTGVAITGTQFTVTSPTSTFLSGDVSKRVLIKNAGPNGASALIATITWVATDGKSVQLDFPAGATQPNTTMIIGLAAPLITTIASVQSSHQITLALAASNAAIQSPVTWGTDDSTAFTNWLGDIYAGKGIGYAPRGVSRISQQTRLPNDHSTPVALGGTITIQGEGTGWESVNTFGAWPLSQSGTGGTFFDLRYDGTAGDVQPNDYAVVSGLDMIYGIGGASLSVNAGTAYINNLDSSPTRLVAISSLTAIADISTKLSDGQYCLFIDALGYLYATNITKNPIGPGPWWVNTAATGTLGDVIALNGGVAQASLAVAPTHPNTLLIGFFTLNAGKFENFEDQRCYVAKINGYAAGQLVMRDLCLCCLGNSITDALPILGLTNTVPRLDNVRFYGNTAASMTAPPLNDAIHLGGASSPLAPTTNDFMTPYSLGALYGGVLRDLIINQCRSIRLRANCENVSVENPLFWTDSGAGERMGAVDVQGGVASPAFGCRVIGVNVSARAYAYAIRTGFSSNYAIIETPQAPEANSARIHATIAPGATSISLDSFRYPWDAPAYANRHLVLDANTQFEEQVWLGAMQSGSGSGPYVYGIQSALLGGPTTRFAHNPPTDSNNASAVLATVFHDANAFTSHTVFGNNQFDEVAVVYDRIVTYGSNGSNKHLGSPNLYGRADGSTFISSLAYNLATTAASSGTYWVPTGKDGVVVASGTGGVVFLGQANIVGKGRVMTVINAPTASGTLVRDNSNYDGVQLHPYLVGGLPTFPMPKPNTVQQFICDGNQWFLLSSAEALLQALQATDIPLTIQGITGQSVDLTQWLNPAGNAVLAKVDKSGNISAGYGSFTGGIGGNLLAVTATGSTNAVFVNATNNNAVTALSVGGHGVEASSSTGGYAVFAHSPAGASHAVYATAAAAGGAAVYGQTSNAAGYGVYAQNTASSGSPLRLQPDTTRAGAPSAAGHANGELYVDQNGVLYFFNGTAWRTVQLG